MQITFNLILKTEALLRSIDGDPTKRKGESETQVAADGGCVVKYTMVAHTPM